MKKRLLVLVFTALVLMLAFPRPVHAQLSWNFPGTNLTNDQNVDVKPAIVRTPNSTLITVYTSVVDTSVALYGQIYNNNTGSWSTQYRLTNEDPNQDTSASLAVFRNGTAFIAWQSNRTGYNDIMIGRTDGTKIWSVQALVTNATNDGMPSVAISRYGTVWVFWVRYSSQTGPYSIFYKTYSGGVWSRETLYTTGASLNNFPSVIVTKDDRVWIVFAERNSANTWQLWTAYNTNGTWSSAATNIVASSNNDVMPRIIQDRAGNIWIIWSREFISGPSASYLLFSTFSSDNGATFPSGNQVQITFDSTLMRDDMYPAVVQGFDKTLWVEYASDPTSSTGMIFNIWLGNSSPITGVADVAISYIRTNATLYGGVGQGQNSTIYVGVTNNGDSSATTTVTLYQTKNSTTTQSGSPQTITIPPGKTIPASFVLLTRSIPPGIYSFKATASPVAGESLANQGDNTLLDGQLKITIPQDLNRDFDIDVDDLTLIFTHQFTTDLAFDVNFDRKVDVLDVISVWQHLYTNIPH